METKALLTDIGTYVKGLFVTCVHPELLYHNLEHTQQVVMHANEIAAYYKLDDDTLFILLTAAWFHDTGHLFGDMIMHEERGVDIMMKYLYDKPVDEQHKQAIARCILATKMPVHPASLLEEILCDADTYHLGTTAFPKMDTLVWQELELRLHKTFVQKAAFTLRFLEAHTFYTDYCRNLLNAQKQENIRLIKARLAAQAGG